MDLLLGAGASRVKQVPWGHRDGWSDLVTLDFNSDHKPDVVFDLVGSDPLPFDADTFDEVHAYHVMEHIGAQGDFRTFFRQFSDIWRILKPRGHFCALGPAWNSRWAWGDPGHTRVISRESLIFLSQPEYAQVGQTPMADYRFVYKADFDVVYDHTNGDHFAFVLEAIKPSRIVRG